MRIFEEICELIHLNELSHSVSAITVTKWLADRQPVG